MKTKILSLLLAALAFTAGAQTNTNTASLLTATVYPGYVFRPGEAPTVAKLNQLGLPTVRITGSLDGSTIARGAIGNDNLNSNAFDQVTIVGGYNSGESTVRVNYDNLSLGVVNNKLGVKTNGITTDHLTNGAVTLPKILTNWLDVAAILSDLAVNVDTNGAGTNSYVLTAYSHQVDTNGVPTNTVFGISTLDAFAAALTRTTSFNAYYITNGFISAEYPLTTGTVANTNHNLNTTPGQVQWVLVNKTNDIGFVAGDEVFLSGVYNTEFSTASGVYGANSTNIFFTLYSTSIGSFNKSTGAPAVMNHLRWRLKCYARP